MKKAGILTYHDSDNFGSVLQAYATCTMLNQAGVDAGIIDLRKPEVTELYRIVKPVTGKVILAANAYNSLHKKALRKRKIRYEQFRCEQMRLTKDTYASGKELSAAELEYDAYITGSDQVWNFDIVDYDEAYLLGFARNGRRIACAASFGPGEKPAEMLAAVKEQLGQFDLLTVRENKAADMVQAAGLPRPMVVPDPVFFLNREAWDRIASPVDVKEPYMLCYFPGVVTEEFEKATRRLAGERGLKRVLLMPHWRNFFRSGRRAYDAGPAEFLGLLRQAEIVCTNSFHATAFSVIYHKNFWVGTHSHGSDTRINTLLQATGLTACEYSCGKPMPESCSFDKADDYIKTQVYACRQAILNAVGV